MRAALILPALMLTGLVFAADPAKEPPLVAKPDAFKTLVNPDCSHCKDEAKRRSGELKDDDRVLCWVRDTKGKYNGGAIPYRFFLNPYRVISDSYGVFVYDPDAGFARGFEPSYDFTFHGWRKGVMVMKHKDGTLYSCLTGIAFDGPKKGQQLIRVPTVVSDWGFWLKHYPDSVAYHMFDKYKPVELPKELNEDSKKSRVAADERLAADKLVFGVAEGKEAKAYPLDTMEKAGMIEDKIGGHPCIVLWECSTRTPAAYRPVADPPTKEGGERRNLTLFLDNKSEGKPLTDKETGSRWDIAGRAYEGKLKGWTLTWLDGTQVKWFAWAAEYPETRIYK
ncbi:MAG TPA: DUF3179 domain-containing (seleno)protein [Gemmataceae bacterium]|jgi:hypothetical protein